ncbi:NAD(P)/FAD-dependent oxidoreductase [Candidatus Margulisiibacteriota bacterium]
MIIEETLPQIKKIAPKNQDNFDVIIIGAGPAGMSAALGAGRADMKVLIMEKTLPGGETSAACNITNYLGFPGGIQGIDLARKMEDHMFNYEIHYTSETAETIKNISDKEKQITTDFGNSYSTKSIILATGLESKKLNNPSAVKFLGRGLSYCAPCDAPLYKDKNIAIIGSGNCACYAADLLSQYAKKIYMVHTSSTIKAVKSLKKTIMANSKITMMWDSAIETIFGIDNVEKTKIANSLTGQYTWIDVKGIFVYIGRVPPEQDFGIEIKKDEKGYIVTDEYMRTNVNGIFAVGDIRAKQIRQIATAVSDGLVAAVNAERYVAFHG